MTKRKKTGTKRLLYIISSIFLLLLIISIYYLSRLNASPVSANTLILTSDTPNVITQIKSGTLLVQKTTYVWKLYKHTSHTCTKSGFQTFLMAYPKGDKLTEATPLMLRVHGGGAGYYNESGIYQGNAANIIQENESSLLTYLKMLGFTQQIRQTIPKTRFVIFSMCDHDYHSGNGTVADPNNPNPPDENGNQRTADGFMANAKATLFALSKFPTSKVIVYGTSAGTYGAFNLASWFQQKQISSVPIALIMDSGVSDWNAWDILINYASTSGIYCGPEQNSIRQRLGYYGRTEASAPTVLTTGINEGWWRAPIYLIWSQKDRYGCGQEMISYTDKSGNVVEKRGTDILYGAIKNTMETLNPGGNSKPQTICVDKSAPGDCAKHVPTQSNQLNTLDGSNYNQTILNWIIATIGN